MRTLIALGALLVVLSGCTSDETRAKPEPIVITYIGSSAPGFAFEDSILQQFTNQTGIKVRFIPGPELNGDQLMHEQKLLSDHASTPDIYFVDVVWPGMLGDGLLDLVYLLPEARPEMLAWLENPHRTPSPLLVRQGRKIILNWEPSPLHIDDRSWERPEKKAQVTIKLAPDGLQVCAPRSQGSAQTPVSEAGNALT